MISDLNQLQQLQQEAQKKVLDEITSKELNVMVYITFYKTIF